MADDLREHRFLFIDRLPENRRRAIDEQLREGKVDIQQLHTLEQGRGIPILSGMIHHWVGVIFIPNATLPQTRAVLDDYDNYGNWTSGEQSFWNAAGMRVEPISSCTTSRWLRSY
jgi:hypothetical protein